MGKHKHISTHHLYLGAGGVISVVALVVALTFGLSSAQTYTPEMSTACATAGGTWNATATPPCQMPANTYTPPPATCIPPPSGCPVGGTWNQTNCTCEGGTYTPPPPMTGTGCTSSQWWDSASSTCKTIDMGGQPGMYPAPITNMPACAPGVMPTAATPCMMPPPPSCPSGQWYDYSKSACTSGMTGTMPTPVNNVQCTPPMQSFSGPNGQSACYDPATLPTCSSTVTSTCKPQGWVAPTTQPVMNQYPAAQTGGDCWNSTSANFASQECTQMRAKVNDAKTTTAQQCAYGFHSTPDMGCVKDMIPAMPTTDWQQFKPGECSQDMQSCPDQWNPSNTVCMPKKMYWDPKTNKNIPEGSPATCEDFKAPTTGQGMGMGMGGFGQGSMPFGGSFGGQGMQGKGQMQWFDMGTQGPGMGKDQGQMNPCEFNPNDPFCKAGFDFGAMQDQYKFDESQFQPQQEYKMNAGDIKREIKNIKMDVKNWTRDVKQVRQQLKEIGRESSGFACPAAIEVSTIAQQYEDAINKVNALNENSSQEEVQTARALGDFIRGKWQDGEQVTEGLQQKLYGGPMDENGERVPGKWNLLMFAAN